MKSFYQLFWSLTVVFWLNLIFSLQAQEVFILEEKNKFEIAGTSTFHDWEMESLSGHSGKAILEINNGKLTDIHSLQLTIPVNSLKSGKSKMERDAYQALKSKKYRNIEFELTEVKLITEQTVNAKGNLTVAGTNPNIDLEADYVVNGSEVVFTGTYNTKFSNFNIKPPKAFLGLLKTGDELDISFEVTFSAK